MHSVDFQDQLESFSKRVSYSLKKNVQEMIPLIGFLVVMGFFAIMTDRQSISEYNLKILINQGVVLAVIATGATFIFTMGAFDISLGALTCLSAVFGAIVANETDSILLMVIVCIGSAIIISLINGACIAIFKLPSFIVTLATMNIMTAAVSLLLGSESMITIKEKLNLADYDTTEIKLAVLIIIMGISIIMFSFNKLGRGNKIIGGNPVVAMQSGISIMKNTILSFFISGIGIGLGAFLLLARTGSVSAQTGSSLGFDIIIAIVLGGMPVSGGARSKITAAIIGAFTVTVLNNGLVIMGVSTGILQAIRGGLFLVVVVLMTIKHRDKLLPR